MRDELRQIAEALAGCMTTDRFRLARRLREMRDAPTPPRPADMEWIRGQVFEARARVERRRRALPRPTYPPELPVSQRREEIARAIREHQVVVVCGETGSGKTTQLPKICLEVGRGVQGVIGHTQPRRIAARAVAERVAEELGESVGRGVGYKVRFGDKTSPDTYIKVMTDGVLLAETQHDRPMAHYDTIIIDEAHERSLNIDFLLGYLKHLLPRRPDLKVVVTSATIDPRRFSLHFGHAPVIEVSGRTYPVEVRYRPLINPDPEHDPENADLDVDEGVCLAVEELMGPRAGGGGGGDVLVFLPGEREIRSAADELRKRVMPGTEVLPLFARLSAAEQQRIFHPVRGRRRVVLATNVAETSLTVPGIKYVVDSGTARVSRYSPGTKVQRLPVEPVSRASADQRKGRCGRVSDGICIRLYSEADYLSRPAFTDPEVLRTNLASVILQMKSLRLGRVEDFPFIDAPDAKLVRDGYDTLVELGAVDDKGELTEVGRRLAKLPVDPRIGRMILAGHDEHCLSEVLVIASALSVQDPRERPMEKQEKADEAHRQFSDETSDFLGLLKLWKFYVESGESLSGSKLRRAAHENFLSYARLREWEATHRQLRDLAEHLGLRVNPAPSPPDAVHRALLAGLLSNVGRKGEQGVYNGCRGIKFGIHPGSALFRKGPEFVVAAELVQTTRLYARTVAKIDPAWIEKIGSHLIKRTHFAPHWSREDSQVYAYEKVLLLGLEVVPRRRVHFGPIDPPAAREVFIQHALVEDEYDSSAPFLSHNRGLIAELKKLEDKTRRHGLAVDPAVVFRFYDRRLGPAVYSGPSLDIWRKQAERQDPRVLFMSRQDLMPESARDLRPEWFPDHVESFGTKLKLDYVFAPGKASDGVTITVPLAALHQLDPARCEWLVPGQLPGKVEALLETLPKTLRKSLGDVRTLASAVASGVDFGKGDLLDAITGAVKTLTGVDVPRDAWRPNALGDHMRLLIRVVDEHSRIIAESRDAAGLKSRFADEARKSFVSAAGQAFSRDGVTTWDFGDLPESVEIKRGASIIRGFPALVDQRTSVSLKLLDSAEEARRLTRRGVRRLFILAAKDELAYQIKLLPNWGRMAMHYAPMGKGDDLRDELTCVIADRCFVDQQAEVRTLDQFEARSAAGWGRLHSVTFETGEVVDDVLWLAHKMSVKLTRKRLPQAWNNAAGDMKLQLGLLVHKGSIAGTPWDRLRHLPRYLRAMLARYEKLDNGGLHRDSQCMAEMGPLWRSYLQRLNSAMKSGQPDPACEVFRWSLEELRVSLFAQELGTAQSVSVKRLEKQWAELTGA